MNPVKILSIIYLFIYFTSCERSIEVKLDDAYDLMKEKKYTEAIDYYNKILSQKPGIQLALYNRGICYINKKKYTMALNDFNAVMAAHPSSGGFVVEFNTTLPSDDPKVNWQVSYFEALYQRAQVKYYMDSIKSAYTDFQTCIKVYYETSNCILWQGTLFLKTNKTDKACEYFNKAMALATNNDDSTEASKMLAQYCK